MSAPITRDELHDLLRVLLPSVPIVQLGPVVQSLHLILKAGKLATAVPTKPRRYAADKPIADSLRLKKP